MRDKPLVQTANINDSDVRDFVVFDTETTGLYPESERIIELGAVRFRDGEPTERFDTFVDPGTHIPASITDLTHISDETVAGAPDIEAALADFEAFVGDDPLVGHNILFAYEFERLMNALTIHKEPVGWRGEQMTLEAMEPPLRRSTMRASRRRSSNRCDPPLGDRQLKN